MYNVTARIQHLAFLTDREDHEIRGKQNDGGEGHFGVH